MSEAYEQAARNLEKIKQEALLHPEELVLVTSVREESLSTLPHSKKYHYIDIYVGRLEENGTFGIGRELSAPTVAYIKITERWPDYTIGVPELLLATHGKIDLQCTGCITMIVGDSERAVVSELRTARVHIGDDAVEAFLAKKTLKRQKNEVLWKIREALIRLS